MSAVSAPGRAGPGRWWRSVAAGIVVCVATGCAAPQARPAASVATRFYASVDASRWTAACALLAPRTKSELEQSAGKACTAALQEEDLSDAGPLRHVAAFGTMTQARFEEDTVFVSEFKDGWKVMAAGCSPVPGHPYDCRLQG